MVDSFKGSSWMFYKTSVLKKFRNDLLKTSLEKHKEDKIIKKNSYNYQDINNDNIQ